MQPRRPLSGRPRVYTGIYPNPKRILLTMAALMFTAYIFVDSPAPVATIIVLAATVGGAVCLYLLKRTGI